VAVSSAGNQRKTTSTTRWWSEKPGVEEGEFTAKGDTLLVYQIEKNPDLAESKRSFECFSW